MIWLAWDRSLSLERVAAELTQGSEKMVELARYMGIPNFAKAAVLMKGLAQEAACLSL